MGRLASGSSAARAIFRLILEDEPWNRRAAGDRRDRRTPLQRRPAADGPSSRRSAIAQRTRGWCCWPTCSWTPRPSPGGRRRRRSASRSGADGGRREPRRFRPLPAVVRPSALVAQPLRGRLWRPALRRSRRWSGPTRGRSSRPITAPPPTRPPACASGSTTRPGWSVWRCSACRCSRACCPRCLPTWSRTTGARWA